MVGAAAPAPRGYVSGFTLIMLLSPDHTVAEKWDCRRKRRDNSDSRSFLRQCGQGFTQWRDRLYAGGMDVVTALHTLLIFT